MNAMDIGRKVIKKLNIKGYQAYFVGGAVRDYIIGRRINDIDIATDATPYDVMNIFKKTVPTGIKHGTVTVLEENHHFEVTTYRSEGKYEDFRHPNQVYFVKDLHEDLSRRDFTINAIAMDLNERLIDPFQGAEDIKKRLIIAVGDPKERLTEDPLRMLRAIRFSAQLGFEISNHTYNEIINSAKYLQYIAIERIKDEFDKILKAPYIDKGLNLLYSSHLIYFFGIDKHVLEKIRQVTIQIPFSKEKNGFMRLALLLFPLTQAEQQAFLDRLKFSNKEIKKITILNQGIQILKEDIGIDSIKKCLLITGKELCINVVKIFEAFGLIDSLKTKNLLDTIISVDKNIPIREIKELEISGLDLIQNCHLPAGPWVRRTLEELFEIVVFDNFPNEKEKLIRKAEEILEKKNKKESL